MTGLQKALTTGCALIRRSYRFNWSQLEPNTHVLRKTSFSMQLSQLLPGRLCYLILVPSTQALCFI